MTQRTHSTAWRAGAGIAGVAAAALVTASVLTPAASSSAHPVVDRSARTATPIKHLVVIFDENISYDHYFGTYPQVTGSDGSPFHAHKRTPRNDNLVTSGKLRHNPNLYSPRRLTPAQAVTCDQNHAYAPEQKAYDGGKADAFVQNVSVDTCTGEYGAPGLTMDYYDGHTVTGLWNYAQHYAMSDRFFDTTFGPSTPGALNLVSGQTHGFREVDSVTGTQVPTPGSYALASPDAKGVGTVINDPDPAFDDCSDKNHTSTNTLAAGDGTNIGDLLNARHVTWGWFQGGFAPTTDAGGSSTSAPTTYAQCGAAHTNIAGAEVTNYSPHHNPFEYYKSTSNPHHLPPSSIAAVGHTDRANHEYDLSVFDKALKAGHLPAVSFLKAPSYQDGHAGYSDPIDEQHFLVKQINALQRSPEWKNTAVVVTYDDSDGWYDHVAPKIKNSSHDATEDDTICTASTAPVAGGYQDRCGPGPRLPMLVISPYAKTNYVDHRPTEQTSVLKFVEDNWHTGRIGDASFDRRAGTLNGLFSFRSPTEKRVLLRANGTVRKVTRLHG